MATYLALWNVKNTIEDTSLIASIGRGLIKVTYLGPGAITPYEPLGSVDSSDSSMSTASITILSVGAAAALVFLGVVLAARRQFANTSTDLVVYESPGTRGVEGSAESDEENGPSSPFSRMIPTAYQYSDHLSVLSGTGLSAVTEITESEGTRSVNSPSGYSGEAGGIGNSVVEAVASPWHMSDSGCSDVSEATKHVAMILFHSCERENTSESVGDDIMSDVSPCPSDESEEYTVLQQQPSVTTSLLLEISSPKGANTSIHEDDDLLFLT